MSSARAMQEQASDARVATASDELGFKPESGSTVLHSHGILPTHFRLL